LAKRQYTDETNKNAERTALSLSTVFIGIENCVRFGLFRLQRRAEFDGVLEFDGVIGFDVLGFGLGFRF
jgi:hypothetical protein